MTNPPDFGEEHAQMPRMTQSVQADCEDEGTYIGSDYSQVVDETIMYSLWDQPNAPSRRCPSEEAGRYFSAVSVSDDTMKTVLGGRLPGRQAPLQRLADSDATGCTCASNTGPRYDHCSEDFEGMHDDITHGSLTHIVPAVSSNATVFEQCGELQALCSRDDAVQHTVLCTVEGQPTVVKTCSLPSLYPDTLPPVPMSTSTYAEAAQRRPAAREASVRFDLAATVQFSVEHFTSEDTGECEDPCTRSWTSSCDMNLLEGHTYT